MVAPLDVPPISVPPALLLTDRVSSCGITWYFDQDYEVGFFINGDPWVKGPIKIVDIKPRPATIRFPGISTTVDVNGTEVNPLITRAYQGFDQMAHDDDYQGRVQYDPNLNKGRDLPFTVGGSPDGTSVVSTESHALYEGRSVKTWPRIAKAAVLTVYPLDHSSGFPQPTGSMSGFNYPTENSFRPPYAKPGFANPGTYNYHLSGTLVDSEHRSGLFVTPTGIPNITGLASAYSCIRLEHTLLDVWAWPHDAVSDNARLYNDTQTAMHSRDIARNIGNAALIYHCSGTGFTTPLNGRDGWPASDPAFRDLKIGVIQRGIDILGICETHMSGTIRGTPPFPFSAKWGVEANHGRLFELLFAAYLLSGDTRMYTAYSGVDWQENEQTFIIDSNTVRVGQNYNTGMTGTAEWGVLHSGLPSLDNAHYRSPSQWRNERADVVSTWWGQTLGAKICGLNQGAASPQGRGIWNHEAYFNYMSRHGNFVSGGDPHPSGDNGLGGTATPAELAYDQWSYDMWQRHKDSFY